MPFRSSDGTHHLAGISKEVAKGEKGNYTTLISDFKMIN
jgi:hypothetical protein